MLNDGFRNHDFAQFESGRFEVRNQATGEIAKITDVHDLSDPSSNSIIVHIAEDGTETILTGNRIFSADASAETPNSNSLNPTGQGHFVSGWDDDEGMLIIGTDDGIGRFRDLTFTDMIFGVRYGAPSKTVLVFDSGADLGATITDADSDQMAAASIALTGLAGDRLVLDPAVLNGTGITMEQLSDKLILLTGEAPIAAYEAVISATTIAIDLDNPQVGNRQIAVTIEDPDGNTGQAITIIEIGSSEAVVAGEANDSDGMTVATADLDPTDDGDAMSDVVVLGDGADRVQITGLSDNPPIIRNFNATEGDRLDLSQLFKGSEITFDTLGDHIRLIGVDEDIAVQVNLDGGGNDDDFVDIALLEKPTGVPAGHDIASIVVTGESEPAMA